MSLGRDLGARLNSRVAIHPKSPASAAARSMNVAAAARAPQPPRDFLELYTAEFDFVWRNLRRLGVAPQQLEDAAQDVFLTAHRRWDAYDSARSSVQSWLFGIALRVAHGYRRTFRRRLARLVSLGDDRDDVAPAAE